MSPILPRRALPRWWWGVPLTRCSFSSSSSSSLHRGIPQGFSRPRSHYDGFVNGIPQRARSGATFDVENPATGQILCSVSHFAAADVENAVQSAREAHEKGVWRNIDLRSRCRVMSRAAELLEERVNEFAELECLQTGRPIREMRAQLSRLPEWLEYFASLLRTHEGTVPPFPGSYLNYVKRIPLGVVGQISPWNHPMLISIKKISAALAAGNTIVMKPSELAPITVIDFAQLLVDAGLPPGVFNVVPGDGRETGSALVSARGIAKIDLTGGTPTGRLVAAAAGSNLASVVAELGGKAPVLVFDDANLEQAVNGAAFAGFVAAGQTCIMGSRVLIQSSVFDQFVDMFTRKVSSIRLGSPWCPETQMGPVISGPQLSKISSFVDDAIKSGATLLTGGSRPKTERFVSDQALTDVDDPELLAQNGYYFEPTVLSVQPSMTCAREEIFGPVVVVYPFETEADAIRLANDSPYGLAASIWSQNIKRVHRVAEQLDVGIIWANDHHRNSPSSPWGGMKDSGMGRENGFDAFHEYTQSKSVVVNTSDIPFDWFVSQQVRYS